MSARDNARYSLRRTQRLALVDRLAEQRSGPLAKAIGISVDELLAVADGLALPTMSSRSRIIQYLVRSGSLRLRDPGYGDPHTGGAEGYEPLGEARSYVGGATALGRRS